MDIPLIAAGAVNQAWPLLRSVQVLTELRQGPSHVFDPTDESTTSTWTHTTEDLLGVPFAPQVEEIGTDMDAFVAGKYKKILYRVSDLPAPAKLNDELTMEGVVWQVKSVFVDPSNTITILLLLR